MNGHEIIPRTAADWSYPHVRMLVFAKAPAPGMVKTRLVPLLGAKGAARLHRRLVLHTLQQLSAAGLAPGELWCAPDPAARFFRACRERWGIALRRQRGGSLGERMGFALRATLRRAEAGVLLGTDCPAVTPAYLRAGLQALQAGNDAVLGPAEDGGYVLLGARRYAPELFTGIPWGSSGVLEETRRRLRQLGWRWHELETLWDVDRPEDYARLKEYLVPSY